MCLFWRTNRLVVVLIHTSPLNKFFGLSVHTSLYGRVKFHPIVLLLSILVSWLSFSIHCYPNLAYVIMSTIENILANALKYFVIIGFLCTAICILCGVWQSCIEFVNEKCSEDAQDQDSRFETMDKFLNDMEREKPIRFTSQQLRIATDNFSFLLGSGGFGEVYKGIFGNGTMVAVKVLNGISNKRIEQQFMAEVSTIGRLHHFNLVHLHGFCFEPDLRALVYEYMTNGSLDKHLFHDHTVLGFDDLHQIALGTARGLAYLHEECQNRIIHYDIKPGNILLDASFTPKVADFGLAKLCNRDNTHITMTGGRGTPGYAAPEMWMPFPVTHKCDVYSYGMLLFEIVGRRRNLDTSLPESQEWFPKLAYKKFESGEMGDLTTVCGIEETYKEMAERMIKVALWCVQYNPQSRPLMSVVLNMLKGVEEIPTPLNPFEHLISETPAPALPPSVSHTSSLLDSDSSQMTTTSHNLACEMPIMKKCEIEIVSC